METTSQIAPNTEMLLILALIAIVLSVIAVGLSIYTVISSGRQKKSHSRPSAAAQEAKELAEKLDSDFESRCKRIARAVMDEDRLAQQKAAQAAAERAAAEKAAEPAVQPEPEKPSFVTEHLYGEYDEQDRGFSVQDITSTKVARSQVEIDTLSPDRAEFSIIPDIDSSLVPGIKDCCEMTKGEWTDYRTIRTVAKGRLELKGDKWNIVEKAKIVLE